MFRRVVPLGRRRVGFRDVRFRIGPWRGFGEAVGVRGRGEVRREVKSLLLRGQWGKVRDVVAGEGRDGGGGDVVVLAEALDGLVTKSGGLKGLEARAAALRVADALIREAHIASSDPPSDEGTVERILAASNRVSSRSISRLLRVCADPRGLSVRRGRYLLDFWLLRVGVLPRSWVRLARGGERGVGGWQAFSVDREVEGPMEGSEAGKHALAKAVARKMGGEVSLRGVEGVFTAGAKLFARARDVRALLALASLQQRVLGSFSPTVASLCVEAPARRRDWDSIVRAIAHLEHLDPSKPDVLQRGALRGSLALVRTCLDVQPPFLAGAAKAISHLHIEAEEEEEVLEVLEGGENGGWSQVVVLDEVVVGLGEEGEERRLDVASISLLSPSTTTTSTTSSSSTPSTSSPSTSSSLPSVSVPSSSDAVAMSPEEVFGAWGWSVGEVGVGEVGVGEVGVGVGDGESEVVDWGEAGREWWSLRLCSGVGDGGVGLTGVEEGVVVRYLCAVGRVDAAARRGERRMRRLVEAGLPWKREVGGLVAEVAVALAERGRGREAVELCERMDTAWGARASGWIVLPQLGPVLLQRRCLAEAETLLEHALEASVDWVSHPKRKQTVHAFAQELLGAALAAGRMDFAVRALRRMEAASITPDIPATIDPALLTLLAAGKIDEALSLATSAAPLGYTPTPSILLATALSTLRANNMCALRPAIAALLRIAPNQKTLPPLPDTPQRATEKAWEHAMEHARLRNGLPVPLPVRAAWKIAASAHHTHKKEPTRP